MASVTLVALLSACGGQPLTSTYADDASTPDATDQNPTNPDATSPKDAAAGTKDASAPRADAGRDAAIDAGPVSPDPAPIVAIPNLTLWLDADVGVIMRPDGKGGQEPKGWTDRSRAKNDGFIAGGTISPSAAFLGHNAYHVDQNFGITGSTGVQISDSPSIRFGTDDLYVAVVARFTNSTSSNPPFATFFRAQYNSQVRPFDNLNQFVFAGNGFKNGSFVKAGVSVMSGPVDASQPSDQLTLEAPYNDGAVRLYTVQRMAGTITLRVNGTMIGSQVFDHNTDLNGYATLWIGNTRSGVSGNLVLGDIGDVMVVRAAFAESDRLTIETYLKTKYGL